MMQKVKSVVVINLREVFVTFIKEAMMRKIKIFVVVTLLGIFAAFTPNITIGKTYNTIVSCRNLDVEGKIKFLVSSIVNDQINDDVLSCYSTFSNIEKVRLFEVLATSRGLSLNELHTETTLDIAGIPNRIYGISNSIQGISWQQLIEHHNDGVYREEERKSKWWVQDPYCDGDGTDTDYVFYVEFSRAISDPNRLIAFSWHPLVDSMLVYYHFQYGGVNGRGHTESRAVTICLGDTGVSLGGGADTIRDNMIVKY
jgi:hypothetical protein